MKKGVAIFFSCLLISAATAQTADLQKNISLAEAYRHDYQFDKAMAVYAQIIQQSSDTNLKATATKWLAACENGKNMLRYADKPTVAGKQTVEIAQFFRFYDFNFGGNWALTPSSWFPSSGSDEVPYISPVFVPDGNPTQLFFAAPGPDGITGWDIYVTVKTGEDQWGAPERLSDIVNSPFDELFPYCPDGKTLYFASNGHFGMGGFDLYKSTFDKASQTWSTPENMGFPYSSPFDDLLFVPDAGGRFSYFASTRDRQDGMITIYKVLKETNPIKQSLVDMNEIRRIAAMEPVSSGKQTVSLGPAVHPDVAAYELLAEKAEISRQKANTAQQELNKLRGRYEASKDEATRSSIASQILTNETQLAQLQDDSQKADGALYKAGEKLLAQGLSIPSLQHKSGKTEHAFDSFLPNERALMSLEGLQIAPPVATESEADMTFRIAATSEVYFDYAPPRGLIYRIQMGVFSNKVDVKLLRGITPVIVEKTPTGKWLYAAGQFTSYADASKALTEVKKRNFRDAVVIARLDGKSISIKDARVEEANPKNKPAAGIDFYQISLGNYTDGLPQALLAAVKEATDKEIARAGNQYMVGSFATREEAERVRKTLHDRGFTAAAIEEVEKK